MRYLTFLLLAILTGLFQPRLQAQQAIQWFANADLWAFHVRGGFAGFDHDFQIKVTGDSTINGQLCQEIGPAGNSLPIKAPRYAYATADQVRVYQEAVDSFVLIYDFTRVVGDQVVIPTWYSGSVFRYRIDDTGTENVAGANRRYQRASQLSPDGSVVVGDPFYMYEGIGMIHKPVQNGLECSYLFLDEAPFCESFVDGLDIYFVCYAGAAGSTDVNGQACTTSTGEPTVQALTVRPNPTSDWLQVDNFTPDARTVARIYNVQGQCLLNAPMTSNALNVNALVPGVYILQIQLGSGETQVGRWVKM